jgi:ABC-type lipoprotein release transport system permease subunit
MTGPKLAAMAWRNLWRNRRRTLVTLVSIAFGGFLAVIFTAMQDRSFADFIDTAARLAGGHVTLQHPEYLDRPTLDRTVAESERLREIALAHGGIRRAVPRVTGQVMLATARNAYGAIFIAYDPASEDESTFSLAEGLTEGRTFVTSQDKGIILGKRLAENLGVGIGKKVVYTLMDRSGEIVAAMDRVVGVVETGAPSLDAGLCLLPVDRARAVLGYDREESTLVGLSLSDSRDSASVARQLRSELGADTAAVTWDEAQPQLAGFIAMKVGGGRVMEIIIMILVAAGIFNTLFVSVMERMREFGIMMALGYSSGQLFRLVMWESVWLGTLGLVASALFTVGPYSYLAKTGIDVAAMTGGEAMEVAGSGFEPILRVGIYPENLLIIAVAIMLATMAAGLYPAWRAGHVVPVESIRLV